MFRPTAVLLASLLLAACSREEGRHQTTAESAAGTAVDTGLEGEDERPDPAAAPTQALLRELANRNEALNEMARLAITRREQLLVSADARRLLTESRRESNRLLGALRAEYRLTHRPSISDQDQTLIDSLNGVGVGEFDVMFLRVVAQHHEDDAKIIERALPTITLPPLRELLNEIRAQRSSEAAEFRKRLVSSPSKR